MKPEQQYIDLFSQTEAMICRHSAEALNAPRVAAFADFERLGLSLHVSRRNTNILMSASSLNRIMG